MITDEKKLFLGLLFFLAAICSFADDANALNGIWVKKSVYDWVVNHPERRTLNDITMMESSIQINWEEAKDAGVFYHGPEPHKITSLDLVSDTITMTYGLYNQQMVFKIISPEVLQVLSHPYDGGKYDYLYRVGNPAKLPLARGVVNEDRVRFRNKPELTSGYFYFLEKGETVEIIGVSQQKQKIGDMEEYWYEICVKYGDPATLDRGFFYIMGWGYGAYIDVEDKKAFEEKYASGG